MDTRTRLTIEVVSRPDVELVVLHGEVDTATAPQVCTALQQAYAAADASRSIVLDLGDVQFLGTAGLAAFADCQTKCQLTGIDLTLVVAGSAVARALQISGLDAQLHLCDTMAEALSATQPVG